MMVFKQGSVMVILAAYPWESLSATRNRERGDARMKNVFFSGKSH